MNKHLELALRVLKLPPEALAELEYDLAVMEVFYAERAAYIAPPKAAPKTIEVIMNPPRPAEQWTIDPDE
jgi:hypothetical protein